MWGLLGGMAGVRRAAGRWTVGALASLSVLAFLLWVIDLAEAFRATVVHDVDGDAESFFGCVGPSGLREVGLELKGDNSDPVG